MILIALAAVVYLGVRWIVKPLLARFSLSDVAGHLESVFPQFDDRLRSTVDFVQQPDAIPGSEVMKDRVVTEATQLAQAIDLQPGGGDQAGLVFRIRRGRRGGAAGCDLSDYARRSRRSARDRLLRWVDTVA